MNGNGAAGPNGNGAATGRGAVPGLVSPNSLALALPELLLEDQFTRGLMAAFDEVLAPIVSTLNNLDAYVDPCLTPPDFLAWLAGWVGLELDDSAPLDHQRVLIAEAVRLYRWRGTVKGMRHLIVRATGAALEDVEIEESGGTSWSQEADAAPSGGEEQRLVVQVRQRSGIAIDQRRLDAVVDAAKPAHLPHEVRVVR
jgi:phage tail-like protein